MSFESHIYPDSLNDSGENGPLK